MSTWEEALWSELHAMSETDQIIATAELITRLQQDTVIRLGQLRRRLVVELLQREEWDAIKLAETLGIRRTTISRLAEEGRALIREEVRAENKAALAS